MIQQIKNAAEMINEMYSSNAILPCSNCLKCTIVSPLNRNMIIDKPSTTPSQLMIGLDIVPNICINVQRTITLEYTLANGTHVSAYVVRQENSPFKMYEIYKNYFEFLIGKPNGLGGIFVEYLPSGSNSSIYNLAGATIKLKSTITTSNCGNDSSEIQFVAPLMERTLHLFGGPARNGSLPELNAPFTSGQFPQTLSQFKQDRDFYGHNYSQCGRNITMTFSRFDFNGSTLFDRGQSQANMFWDMQHNFEYAKPYMLLGMFNRNPKLLINDVIFTNPNYCSGATQIMALTSLILRYDYKFGDSINTYYYIGATYNDGINNIWDNSTENNNGQFYISSGIQNSIASNLDVDKLRGYYLGWNNIIESQLIDPTQKLGWV